MCCGYSKGNTKIGRTKTFLSIFLFKIFTVGHTEATYNTFCIFLCTTVVFQLRNRPSGWKKLYFILYLLATPNIASRWCPNPPWQQSLCKQFTGTGCSFIIRITSLHLSSITQSLSFSLSWGKMSSSRSELNFGAFGVKRVFFLPFHPQGKQRKPWTLALLRYPIPILIPIKSCWEYFPSFLVS